MAHSSEFNIKITLERKRHDRNEGIPIDTFRKATNHFTNLLKHLTPPRRDENRWQIHRNSTLDREYDDFGRDRDRWETTSERVNLLLSGEFERMSKIEEEILRPLQVLHDPVYSEALKSKGFSLYPILGPKVCAPLRVLANIKEGYVTLWLYGKPFLLTGKSHLFIKLCDTPPPPPPPPVRGSVAGQLVAMSSKNSNHQIVIFNPIFGSDIIGKINRSSNLMEKATQYFQRFVELEGIVTSKGGVPIEIEVESIAEIDSSHEKALQVTGAVRGILKGYVSPDELE